MGQPRKHDVSDSQYRQNIGRRLDKLERLAEQNEERLKLHAALLRTLATVLRDPELDS